LNLNGSGRSTIERRRLQVRCAAEAETLLFKGTDFGATDVEIVKLG
jgi:hypothetical protein